VICIENFGISNIFLIRVQPRYIVQPYADVIVFVCCLPFKCIPNVWRESVVVGTAILGAQTTAQEPSSEGRQQQEAVVDGEVLWLGKIQMQNLR